LIILVALAGVVFYVLTAVSAHEGERVALAYEHLDLTGCEALVLQIADGQRVDRRDR
jgi:hypothetical protein